MDENCITITKSDEVEIFFEIFFYVYELEATMTELYNIMINDFFNNLFQQFLSQIYNFKNRHKPKRISRLTALLLYKWAILHLEAMPLTQSYDDISKMLRRIYLIHRQRTTSVTDDSTLCDIA